MRFNTSIKIGIIYQFFVCFTKIQLHIDMIRII